MLLKNEHLSKKELLIWNVSLTCIIVGGGVIVVLTYFGII